MDLKLNAIIEIQANTFPVKYEFDAVNKRLAVDRVLGTCMFYSCDYGFIENTMAQDGDALDVLIYSDFRVLPGSSIMIKPVGCLMMEDEKGLDEKVLAVPHESVDPRSARYNELCDIPQVELDKIKHFFEHYKDLESNKWVKVREWASRQAALDIIKKYTINS